jgi:hypothetical protein
MPNGERLDGADAIYVVSGRVMSPDSAAVDGLIVALWDCNVGVNPEVVTRGLTDVFGRFSLTAHIAEDHLRARCKSSPDLQVAALVDGQAVASSASRGR